MLLDYRVIIGIMDQIFTIVGTIVATISFIFQFLVFVKNKKFLQVVSSLLLIVSTGVSVYFWNQIQLKNNISVAATKLVQYRHIAPEEYYLEDSQFIMASLAFLEKNKDIYPDSYKRAQTICENNYCNKPQYKQESSDYNSLDYGYNTENAAKQIEGILKGISMLEK